MALPKECHAVDTNETSAPTPHRVRDLDNPPQFGALILDRQRVAANAAGEAALRADTQPIESNVSGGFVDTTFEVVDRFKRRHLRTDETQHDPTGCWHET